MIKKFKITTVLGLCILLYGCMSMGVGNKLQLARSEIVEKVAVAGWQKKNLPTEWFNIISYVPAKLTVSPILTVYIEGDGFAWISRTQPSSDPTPINPLALYLAMQDQTAAAVYLARPCQYVMAADKRGCGVNYWTRGRYSEQVISSMDEALNQLVAHYDAKQLVLVGYSGGGAVAALLAVRRHDVSKLVTIAGNLDHQTWTNRHHISPLSDSLNPADYWQALQTIEQVHYVGSEDTIINRQDTLSYLQRFPATANIEVIEIAEVDHSCCWLEYFADKPIK